MSPNSALVLDTNVLLVANGQAEQTSDDCKLACISLVRAIEAGRVLVLDSAGEIFGEYRRSLGRAEQRVGWAFLRWIHDHQFNPDRCALVTVAEHPERGYEAFPADTDLVPFDRDDRKFVAVALSSALRPPIANAVDSDWWDHEPALRRHGVVIEFVCSDQVERWRRQRPRR